MSEHQYFEQFAGDVDDQADDIPAFSPDCPECHGTGFVETGVGIVLTRPCYRCWELVGR